MVTPFLSEEDVAAENAFMPGLWGNTEMCMEKGINSLPKNYPLNRDMLK